jgi:hypothetical protein
MEKNNIIGVFEDEDVLVRAIRKLKEHRIKIDYVLTPFPVEKVFEELGLKTRLPYATFIYGFIGVTLTFVFLYWTSVINYPLKFGGKPLNSLSFIIIMFVLTINTAVVLTLVTFFIRQKIGPGKKSVVIDERSTDDKFIIVIHKAPEMTAQEIGDINDILKDSGAVEIYEKTEPADFKADLD